MLPSNSWISRITYVLIIAATKTLQNNVIQKQNMAVQNFSEFSLDKNGPDVQFVLFTRNHPPVTLKINDHQSLQNSGLKSSNPTKIIVHGFQSSIKEDVFVVNKNAYLETDDFNVIGMDWSMLCEYEYLSAINGARKAGKILKEFVEWLTYNGVDINELHIIGHSLGAHVAGIAGGLIKNGKIGRITGLDPAAPGFRETNLTFKLDSSDAKIVDVIHTYMKVLSLSQPIGHIDFYPNGGRWQPGCPDIYDIWQVAKSLVCNHARAYYFFAESIRNKNAFRCKRCKSVDDALYGHCLEKTNVYMGQVDTYEPGLYYLQTKDKPPYSLNDMD